MWTPAIAVLMVYFYFFLCFTVSPSASIKIRFKSDVSEDDKIEDDQKAEDKQTADLTSNQTHCNNRELYMRFQASVIVLIILFSITAGMFCCRRYVPV